MTWIDAVQSKLPRPDGRDEAQINDDLDVEFAFHLEMRAKQLETEGIAPDDACGVALSMFGDLHAIKSQCRRLVLQERIMLQRVNFVMMIVVLLMVVGVGVQVMVTQNRTTNALKQITTQLSQLNDDSARRGATTGRLNAEGRPVSGVWREVGESGQVLETGSQLAILDSDDERNTMTGMGGVLLLAGDTSELGLVFHTQRQPNLDVWTQTAEGKRSHEANWSIDANQRLVLDLPPAVTAKSLVIFTRIRDVPSAVFAENPGANGGVVQVQGEVARTGAFQLPALGEMTLRRALTAMGGPKGNAQRVRVTRLQNGQMRDVFQTDKFGSDPSVDFMLNAGDIVIVGDQVATGGGAGAAMSDAARADAERAKADAISRFLQEILAASEPQRGPLEMREVLDNASKRIDSEFADNPEVAARLRETVAKAKQQLHADATGDSRPRVDDDPFPKLSPFREVRWKDSTPFVDVDGTWGELVSINDVPVGEIIDHCRKAYSGSERVRFAEDLVRAMTEMNKAPGTAVKVQFKDLKTGTVMSIGEAPMTSQNRDRIVRENDGADNRTPLWTGEPPPPAPE